MGEEVEERRAERNIMVLEAVAQMRGAREKRGEREKKMGRRARGARGGRRTRARERRVKVNARRKRCGFFFSFRVKVR